MSIAVMTEVWKDAPVAGTQLLMLLALADSSNDDRECWPSVRHLQHKVRVSEPQARKLLKQLELQGLIEIDRNKGKGIKGRESNLYRICGVTPIAQDTSTPIAQDTLNHYIEPSLKNTSPIGNGLKAPKIPKVQLDTEFDTLSLIWNGSATGFIVNIQGMLFGTKKVKGEWNKCKLLPPATCTEVIAFADYAQRRKSKQNLDAIPTAPDTIQRWFCDYRMEREKAIQRAPSDGYSSIEMNAAMFSEGKTP